MLLRRRQVSQRQEVQETLTISRSPAEAVVDRPMYPCSVREGHPVLMLGMPLRVTSTLEK